MENDRETNKIFIFGLCVLIAWMFIIVICASPKLFRNALSRLCFCFIARKHHGKSGMHYANCLQLKHVITAEPSNIMITQAFGSNFQEQLYKLHQQKLSHSKAEIQSKDLEI